MKLLLGQLFEFLFVFYLDVKSIQWRNDSIFNKWYSAIWNNVTMQKNTTGHYLSLGLKLNSKCIKDVYRRPDTLNQLEEEVGACFNTQVSIVTF